MLKSLLREPLVHFLLPGATLFALDAFFRPSPDTAAGGEIVERRPEYAVETLGAYWPIQRVAILLRGLA